jgi:hypothetical protein
MTGSAPIAFRVAQGAEQMVDDDGDKIGQAEPVTMPQGFMAKLGERDLGAEPGCPAAVLRNRRLAFHFVSSSTPRRTPSRSGMRGVRSVRPRRRRAGR